MPEIRRSPFGTARTLQNQIDEFLDAVAEGSLVFAQALSHYLDEGPDELLEERYEQISDLERRGDQLRRHLETTLFTEMLIPDARGDVLGLLDDLDHLLDQLKKALQGFVIEQPEFPVEARAKMKALVAAVAGSVEATVSAARTYFRDPAAVRDLIHKIGHHEHEADLLGIHLRKLIFASALPLERKLYLRLAVIALDAVADKAEDTGDRLAIYAVKRGL